MENEIDINGTKYLLASSKNNKRASVANKKFVMARTYSAGVFAGHLKSRKGKEVVLQDAVRIHYWEGAASLSELAQRGTSKPEKCRFPVAVDEVFLTECIELIPISKASEKLIKKWSGKWTR